MSDKTELLHEALLSAEAALADIGDADREPGDDVAWCEARAAEVLPEVRGALVAWNRQATIQPTAADPVGEAGTMPGTSGFTMACFKADAVPVGAKLYTAPVAPADAATVLESAAQHWSEEGYHNTANKIREYAASVHGGAPADAVRDAKIPRENNDKLIELARYWKLDGDWMTCKGCKRSLIASRDGEELAHSDGCKFAAQQHPWGQLRAFIAPSTPKEPAK